MMPCPWSLGEGGSLSPRADRYWMGFPAAALRGQAERGVERGAGSVMRSLRWGFTLGLCPQETPGLG